MPAMDADTPSKPFGGTEEIAFTPDGKGLVFTARDAGREEAWSTDLDLYYVPVDGSAPPVCLTEANKATDTTPAFSPDGKTLAYLAMAKPGYEADRFRIVLRAWPDGEARVLDRGLGPLRRRVRLDARTGQRSWRPLPTGARPPSSPSMSKPGKPRRLVGQGTVAGFAAAGDGVVFERNTLKSPTEIYSVKRRRERVSGP